MSESLNTNVEQGTGNRCGNDRTVHEVLVGNMYKTEMTWHNSIKNVRDVEQAMQ